MIRYDAKIVALFWSKVAVGAPDECWPWLASTNGDGYGYFYARGRRDGAHRAAWEIRNGQRIGKKLACHTCDNPSCCNPAHIYRGTRQDNIRDAIERGQHWTSDQAGEANGNSKLTADDVDQIRSLMARGAAVKAVAESYGVSGATIYAIRSGKAWPKP